MSVYINSLIIRPPVQPVVKDNRIAESERVLQTTFPVSGMEAPFWLR